MRLCFVLLLAALLFAETAFAAPVSSAAAGTKMEFSPEMVMRLRHQHCDPFLAGLLSGAYWGLGHFYAKDYGHGSLFVFSDLVYKGLALGLAIKLKNKYISADDGSMRWRDMSGTDKGLVVGAAAIWLGVTVLSIYDASEAARKYNSRTDALLHAVDVNLREREGSPVFCLDWKAKF